MSWCAKALAFDSVFFSTKYNNTVTQIDINKKMDFLLYSPQYHYRFNLMMDRLDVTIQIIEKSKVNIILYQSPHLPNVILHKILIQSIIILLCGSFGISFGAPTIVHVYCMYSSTTIIENWFIMLSTMMKHLSSIEKLFSRVLRLWLFSWWSPRGYIQNQLDFIHNLINFKSIVNTRYHRMINPHTSYAMVHNRIKNEYYWIELFKKLLRLDKSLFSTVFLHFFLFRLQVHNRKRA